MQLEPAPPSPSVLGRLRAAACVLLAAGVPAAAHADPATASWQFEASTLAYGEKDRAKVLEPAVRLTRLFAGGASLAAQFAFDVITGASPTGARPSGGVQTITTPSGGTTTVVRRAVAADPFHDRRWPIDLDWQQPVGTLFDAGDRPALLDSRRTTSRRASARSSRSTPITAC